MHDNQSTGRANFSIYPPAAVFAVNATKFLPVNPPFSHRAEELPVLRIDIWNPNIGQTMI